MMQIKRNSVAAVLATIGTLSAGASHSVMAQEWVPVTPGGVSSGRTINNGGVPNWVPTPGTRINQQTVPMFGGAAGAATTATDAGAVKEFRIIPVNHVYVGGILALFSGNVGVVSTLQFVATASAQQSSQQNGQNGQQGGFGGSQGGGVGGIGGDTGGGFGGNTGGGFGGNTGGTGGITF
jgi:hypothetical protein